MGPQLPIWLVFVLAVLAVFRLSLLFSKENGPGRIFHKMRKATPAKSSLREGVSCVFCESIWWSALAVGWLIYLGRVEWVYSPFWWLGVSAGAIILNQQWTKGDL